MSRLYGITGADLDDMPLDEVNAYLADLREIAKARRQQQQQARKKGRK